MSKAFAMGSKPTPETFPELPDVLVWFRFFLAIAYGTYLGVNGVMSNVMPLQALNLICFVPLIYARFYLGVEAEVFATEVIFSGLLNAIALSVLIWIYWFTMQHEAEEAGMAAFLLRDNSTMAAPPVEAVVEESEF